MFLHPVSFPGLHMFLHLMSVETKKWTYQKKKTRACLERTHSKGCASCVSSNTVYINACL